MLLVFDADEISYRDLLAVFWEAHNPTQGMSQGNDIGTQYHSAIYYADDEQRWAAEKTSDTYDEALRGAGYGPITTEIAPAGPFYYAEGYHQQYLYKVPNGYCGLGGTGVSCPVGLGVGAALSAAPARTEEEWRKRLSPKQYAVLREAATERPFSGEYVDTDEAGLYHCAACGNAHFDGRAKYHSGIGWPSFTEVVSPDAVELLEDHSHRMVRTEVHGATPTWATSSTTVRGRPVDSAGALTASHSSWNGTNARFERGRCEDQASLRSGIRYTSALPGFSSNSDRRSAPSLSRR